jgi:AbiJ N-terminal domain 4
MTNDRTHIPFSQRSGLAETPPQLKIGEVSDELRRLFSYYMEIEIDKFSRIGVDRSYFEDKWKRVATDFYVFFLSKRHDEFNGGAYEFEKTINHGIKSLKIGPLFDMVEFFYRHPNCSTELKTNFQSAFVTARAAYRIIDGQIVAIGSDEQGAAFEKAILDTESKGVVAARTHLIASGSALRNGDWAGSVRESIHAVESMALQLAPDASTLGPALTALEKKGHLHGSLKAAFGSLYGYSSDEEGIRHALVLKGVAQVDETDALFMLGACASFVSYLLARGV